MKLFQPLRFGHELVSRVGMQERFGKATALILGTGWAGATCRRFGKRLTRQQLMVKREGGLPLPYA